MCDVVILVINYFGVRNILSIKREKWGNNVLHSLSYYFLLLTSGTIKNIIYIFIYILIFFKVTIYFFQGIISVSE